MKQHLVSILICLLSLALIVTFVVLPAPGPETSSETCPETIPETTAQSIVPIDRESKLIGICLPSQTAEWSDAALLLQEKLEEAGYRTEIAYGNGTAQGQQAAIRGLKEKNADCLVVAPVDSAISIEDVVSDIPVLAYGSLLMDTDRVAGYICYDYYSMGATIAQQIENALRLYTAAEEGRSYTLELFMGAARDYNAILLHNGLRSVLDGYLENGVLVCNSGRLEFEDCSVAGWSAEQAEAVCMSRLEHNYPDAAPTICIAASDAIATGVIHALEASGLTQNGWPLISGNGATEEGLANMEAGKQFLTVSTDPADPAEACVAMTDLILFGAEPTFALENTFNHVVQVPTALCDFRIIGE